MPARTQSEASTFAGNFSNDCGNRWMKASPNKLPTARLTMTKIIRFSLCSLIEMKAIPTNESRLTKTTLTRL